MFRVTAAALQYSANSQIPLTARSVDELDAMRPDWRYPNNSGDPLEYYVTSKGVSDSAANAIGFVPIPASSTGVTYPRIALYGTIWAQLSGTETVPDNLLTDNYYLYDMYAKWTAYTDASMSAYWEARAQGELQIERDHVQNVLNQASNGAFMWTAYGTTPTV